MAITIEAQKRDESKNPRQLRAAGFLPATIYGKGKDSVSIQLNKRAFINTYKNNKNINIKDINLYYNELREKYHLYKEFNVRREFDIFRDWENITVDGYVEFEIEHCSEYFVTRAILNKTNNNNE